MKKYLSFFRIRFNLLLQYRGAAYAGMVTQFFWGIMTLLMFHAFYEADPNAFPMTFSQLSAYIWIQQSTIALLMVWFLENDIFEEITSGGVAYSLVRPLDLYTMWFTKNVATRLAKAALRFIPIILIAFLLPVPYRMSLPASWLSFICFIGAMILAVIIVVAYCMLIYIATFHTMNPMGIRIVATSMTEFFSGAIIPLAFLPATLRTLLEWSPFGSMVNFPLQVYNGNIQGSALVQGLFLQLVWAVVLVFVGKWWMQQSLKKVIVQGG